MACRPIGTGILLKLRNEAVYINYDEAIIDISQEIAGKDYNRSAYTSDILPPTS